MMSDQGSQLDTQGSSSQGRQPDSEHPSEYNNVGSSQEKKAINRMVAEGYKYHALSEAGESDVLDPIEDGEEKTQRRRWRTVRILMVVAVVIIALLAAVIIIQHKKYNKQPAEVCTTSECVENSAYILEKMDTTVDPCQDFYMFSCGQWIQKARVPASVSKYGSFTMIADRIMQQMKELLSGKEQLYKGKASTAIHKAYQYYHMCMNETTIEQEGTTPAIKLINHLGSWTLTTSPVTQRFDPSTWNIQDALLLSHRLLLSPLFVMVIGVDEKNSSRYVIKFEQAGLTLSDRKQYSTNHTDFQKFKTAFIKFGTELGKLLGGTGNVEQNVTEIFNFEQKLAKIFVPREKMIDPVSTYHKMTVQEFQNKYVGQWINIGTYMRGMFSEIATVTSATEVVVYTPDYFTKLQDVIKQTDKTTLANYIVWHGVVSMLGYLNKEFTKVGLILDNAQTGIKDYPPRWKRCLGKVEDSLGFATGALYVEKYFAESSKEEVESIFEEIRAAFIANLDNVPWMDKTTAKYAKEKAAYVEKMLGYPEYIKTPEQLDKHYENISIVQNHFFGTKLALKVAGRLKNLAKLGTIPDRNEWSMVPTEVNGYYSSDYNHIAFTAAILSPPLFKSTSPKSFKFGSFGMIAGHELTHGFDNKGRNFDKYGNMREWWSASSTKSFNEQSKCFTDFYSNYTVDGTHLNGETTLSENIADNGGMKMAFLAFKEWQNDNKVTDTVTLPGMAYNPEQLFFLGMSQIWCSHYTPEYMQQAILTDEHSIAKFRVLGSMSNSDDFAHAFNCPVGSKMNPKSKCQVW